MSSASYENVVTTFKSYSTNEKSRLNNHLELSIGGAVKIEPLACVGAGFGIAVVGAMLCQNPAAVATQANV